MGTWGTGLSSNDTFEDIYSDFIEKYNAGHDIRDITDDIILNFSELQSDHEDKNSFWFALAKAQWDCGSLDSEIYEKVKTIIESGDDLILWTELNGTSGEVKKRKKVLDDFLEKISTSNTKPKKRKKLVIRQPIFEKGDCLVFKLKNNNYGGALVLEAERDTDLGMNMMAVTTINQLEKPTTKDFEKAYLLTERQEGFPGKYRERECIFWSYAQFFKKAETKFEVIGKLSVSKQYNSKDHCYMAGQWDFIPAFLDNLEDYQKKHGIPTMVVMLKEWT